MSGERILVVEDEPAIADAVEYALADEGYRVAVEPDGARAAEAPVDEFDLIILDLMLPGLPGFEVCKRVRERSPVPIVVLTARGGETDRVLGLELGADDYVAKPFSMPELVSRVRAQLRRRRLDRTSTSVRATVGGLELDLVERTVTVDGRDVLLTPSEFRLLALLAQDPERVFTRSQIVRHLWRASYAGDGRTCDVHIKNIRKKIERDPALPERLVTMRGVGYMLRPA
jgi:two-component system response regulator RegX3